MMLCRRFLGAAALYCRHAERTPLSRAALRHCCVDRPRPQDHALPRPQDPALSRPRDHALPNPSWSGITRQLYERYLRDSATWRRVPSYSANHHYSTDNPMEAGDQRRRRFTRIAEEDGAGFEYCMFYNQAKRRMACIFQPGPFLEGYPGYTHGGVIATIIDITMGKLIMHACGRAMTANLNINYRSPVMLGDTVLVDARLDKMEGQKIYTGCRIRSCDETLVHAEATGLFIKVDLGEGVDYFTFARQCESGAA